MSGFTSDGGGNPNWLPVYPNVGSLPSPPPPGQGSVAVVTNLGAPDVMYEWDNDVPGWLPIASAGGAPAGPASGDLGGFYPNPTVRTKRYMMEFRTINGVPAVGPRYLDRASIACTAVQTRLQAAATLIGITIQVNAVDGARSFSADVVTNPGGVEVLLGSLPLGSGVIGNQTRALAVPIPALTLWGVKLTRTAGLGASTFADCRVEVEVEMP